MIIEAKYIPKLEKLLNSDDEANHIIAFQLMSEAGAPADLHPAMTNQISKIQLCMQYGFRDIVANRRVYLPDEFVQNAVCTALDLPYGSPLHYQELWRLEKLSIPEPPARNHFTFGLEDDATDLEGLQFATQLKELSITNHEMNDQELNLLANLPTLEVLKLKGISRGIFRMKNIQDWTPLGHLSQLKQLALVDCQLDSVSFLAKNMEQLERINLQHNQLNHLLDLVDNPAIKHCTVDARNNPLATDDLPRQIERLKLRKVEVLV